MSQIPDPPQPSRDATVEAMARHILDARRDGEHGLVDLTRYGWSLATVMRYASAARELAATPAFAARVAADRLRAAETHQSADDSSA